MSKFTEVLKDRNFFLLWLGQIISQLGDRLDQMALMEVIFYARQLRRMGRGQEPQPDESPLKAALLSLAGSGWKGLTSRRLRA